MTSVRFSASLRQVLKMRRCGQDDPLDELVGPVAARVRHLPRSELCPRHPSRLRTGKALLRLFDKLKQAQSKSY